MTATTLKSELHNTIESINDKNILEAIFTLLNKQAHEYVLTRSRQTEPDRRLKLLEEGKVKTTPYKKSLKTIRAGLKK